MMCVFSGVLNTNYSSNGFLGRRPRTSLSVCHQCSKVYKHKHTLMRHLRYECNKKPAFACIYCNYAAKRKYILLEHVRGSHKEEFPNFSSNIYKFLYPDGDVAKSSN